MIRILGLALVAVSFTFAACGSSKTAEAPPAEETPAPTMAPADALVGTWQDGTSTFTFGADKNFRWQQTRPCGSPPCPVTTSAGKYEIRSGKIYVTLDGDTEVMEMAFNGDQSQLTLSSNKRGASWTLGRGM